MARLKKKPSIKELSKLRDKCEVELDKKFVFKDTAAFADHVGVILPIVEEILDDNGGELRKKLVLVDQTEELCTAINTSMAYIKEAKKGIEVLGQLEAMRDKIEETYRLALEANRIAKAIAEQFEVGFAPYAEEFKSQCKELTRKDNMKVIDMANRVEEMEHVLQNTLYDRIDHIHRAMDSLNTRMAKFETPEG